MFTGLVEEVGNVKAVSDREDGRDFEISCQTVLSDLEIDHSVSINGACHTVTALGPESFFVHSVAETLRKTCMGNLSDGSPVNLERAVKIGTRLGGHMVQGHVDCRAVIRSIVPDGDSHLVTIELPEGFERYVIPVGSICIDGISLTAARVDGCQIGVAIIPHTWKHTTLGNAKAGDLVNIEVDMIGKYIEKLFGHKISGQKAKTGS